MILKKYNSIMEKPEEYRNRWALGLSIAFSAVIFLSFAFYKGYLSLGNDKILVQQKSSTQTASVATAPSPISSSKETLKTAFKEIDRQYEEFKNTISNVLVPFFTGIEVYKRE